jgi:hypothetical protein
MRLMRRWHWILITLASGMTAVAILRTAGSRPAFYVGQTADEYFARISAYEPDQLRLPPFRCNSVEVIGGSDAIAFVNITDYYLRRGHVFAQHRIVATLSDRTRRIIFVRSTWKWTPWRL